MNPDRTISVIIPTFNRAHLIKEAVDSVLSQDIRGYDVEVLVIDDGSSDNTRDVLRVYGDRIRYVFQENSGAGVARNRGLREAKGKWITFLDSDDRWLPYKLSLQIAIIEKIPDCKVLYGNFRVFNQDGILFDKGVDYWATYLGLSTFCDWKEMFQKEIQSADLGITHDGKSFSIYKGNVFRGLVFQPCIPCWTSIIARECITDKIRFAENYPTWEDIWFFCQLAQEQEIYFMDVNVAENRGHTGARLTQAHPIKRILCHIDICDKIYYPSTIPRRPSEDELNALYTKLHEDLFISYLKEGMQDEARKVRKKLDTFGEHRRDIRFALYHIASLMPGRPVHQLARLKRLFTES